MSNTRLNELGVLTMEKSLVNEKEQERKIFRKKLYNILSGKKIGK